MNKTFLFAAWAVFAVMAVPAFAHVGLEYTVAPAGSHYKATFKIGHGCEQAPTRQLAVRIPPGVRGVRPMPKPGWDLAIERGTRPSADAPGEVLRVVWTARTPADQYDEFSLVGRMPAQTGLLYWPVQQLCEGASHQWDQVPAPGQAASALKSPAPALELIPAGTAAGHVH